MAGPKKNDIKPWIVKTWCVPPKANAAFVWRMEDVLQTYLLPYVPYYPVVCFDEACKQLWIFRAFGDVSLAGTPWEGSGMRQRNSGSSYTVIYGIPAIV